MMTLVNLTPHAINFVDASGAPLVTIEPSGQLARVTSKTVVIGEIDGIPVTATEYGEVEGLPAPLRKDDPRRLYGGVGYIVSSLVASRVPDRDDVFIPNESVRDAQGRIVGCRSLGRV